MTEKLLLINDLACYGKVALGAMTPLLAHMGYDVCTLPTMLVSNTREHGQPETLETTDFLEGTLKAWERLGLSFDAIATGLVASNKQAQVIADFCATQHDRGTLVFVDPVMGDGGQPYQYVDPGIVGQMRRLVAVSDVALPNYTEACLLTGAPFSGAQGMTERDVMRLLDCLRRLCPRSVVVTSANVEGSPAVIGYDHERDEHFIIPFEEIEPRFPGTGDIFAAALMGKKLAGKTLEDATACAMHVVKDLIRANQDAADTLGGIPVERSLGSLTR